MRKKNLLTGHEVDEPGGHDPDFYPAGTWGGGEDHDPELDELDAMWAEEHKRPQGHGKLDNLDHWHDPAVGWPTARVERGARVPGLNGVGQEDIDGFITERNRQVLASFIQHNAMQNIGRSLGYIYQALKGGQK